MKKIQASDKRVFAMIRSRIIKGEKTPTLKEINALTGKKSFRSAVLVLERLQKAGLIVRNGRSIQLGSGDTEEKISVTTKKVPLVGSVSAGGPMLAEENIEAYISVSTEIVTRGKDYFFLRVFGDSMNLETIKNKQLVQGALLLVKVQQTAENGDVIVALIDDEATVKKIYTADGYVVLEPNSTNEEHKPILLKRDFIVQGKVIDVMHM